MTAPSPRSAGMFSGVWRWLALAGVWLLPLGACVDGGTRGSVDIAAQDSGVDVGDELADSSNTDLGKADIADLMVSAPDEVSAPDAVEPDVEVEADLPGADGGNEVDAGIATLDADDGDHDASQPLAEPLGGMPGQWSWVPVDGSECARGARAGIGWNPSGQPDDLFIFVQGGGGCWNQGTCAPSLLSFGPICEYGNLCLYDGSGGQQPTAVHVTEADPYPASGLGNFASEVAAVSTSVLLDRANAASPFRNASFVYVPYCTGDMHAGESVQTYSVKRELFGPVVAQTFHFSGAKNMRAYLARIAATLPNLKRVWVVGVSGGGYGAQLNTERFAGAFPGAQLHILADSAPLLPTPFYPIWSEAWQLKPPTGCIDCETGFPAWLSHFANTYPQTRLGLLVFDRDRVITWFFYGGNGLQNFLFPPFDFYQSQLDSLLSSHYRGDNFGNLNYFLQPGESHVFLGTYEAYRSDGSVAAPPVGVNGVSLREFIDGWALGGADWVDSQ